VDSLSVSVSVSSLALVLEREEGLAEWEKMRKVSSPRSFSGKWTFLGVDGAERARLWRGWIEIPGEGDLREDLRGWSFWRVGDDVRERRGWVSGDGVGKDGFVSGERGEKRGNGTGTWDGEWL